MTGDLRATYDAVAAAWDESRSRRLFERPWLDRLLAIAPEGAPVLDIGCGSGEPVAAFLIAAGRRVTGVDFAPAMLAICRARFPGETWIEADMRGLDLGRRFGGVVAWDSFFHLDAEAQRAMIPVFASHLLPGGALLFTSGPEAGAATGAVAGRPVPHASLAPSEYAARIEAAGMTVRAFVAEDPDCAGHSIWLARRR